MPWGIILVDCKSTGVAVFAVIKGDLFPDVGGADQSLSCRIPTQPKVIQCVRRWSGLFPYSIQKLLVIGGRPEFIISVPSLCHVAYPSSISVPSGIPVLPLETNFTFQRPTIPAWSESSSQSRPWLDTSTSDACRNLPWASLAFRCGRAGAVGASDGE